MKRTVREKYVPRPKPVEKAELSEEHLGWRIGFFILFLLIAATAFAYGVNAMFSTEPGWQEIEVDASADVNCGNEFILLYQLGVSGVDATAENKAIRIIYTDACERAYKLFHEDEVFEEVNNVCYINQHPNEEIVVDEVLYEAFSLMQKYGNRNLYLAPVYEQYDEIFLCEDDSQLVYYDPYLNDEVAADYQEIAAYANNSEMVDIKLLGDNTIKLHVSEEYLAYAAENGITDYIDFFWMQNAFIIDYLADVLTENGYTAGTLTSYDGFSKSLYEGEESFSFNVYDKDGETGYQVTTMYYSGVRSIVYLRNYVMNNLDAQHYYTLSNGEIRTSYIDVADGFEKTATDNLYSYSDQMGCAEILMQIAPVYVADEFDEAGIVALAEEGIYSIYFEDTTMKYNDSSLVLADTLADGAVKYQASYVGK